MDPEEKTLSETLYKALEEMLKAPLNSQELLEKRQRVQELSWELAKLMNPELEN